MPTKTKDKKKSALRYPKNNRLLLLFVILIFGIAGYFLLFSKAAPAPPAVYLTAPTATYMPINTTFTVQLRETSGATTVNAVQANFSYPATLVDFVSIDTTGTAFTTNLSSSGGSGLVSIARGLTASSVTGDQLIATITFKTKITGGTVTVAFTTGTQLASSTTNLDILGGLGATAGFTTNVDTTAPTVSVTAPAAGASLAAGTTITVSATASDADRVVSVDIYIDGVKVSTIASSPYNYAWNTSGLSLGSHTIQAKATDPSANLGTSSLITVTLADQTAPTVAISAPVAASTVRAAVTISATAADNSGGTGLAKVEFYVDAVLKGTALTSPYSLSWDSTTATNATHSLTAKAYDNATPANSATSAAVSVTVDNSVPTTPGTFRTTGNSTSSIALAWNASSDNIAVTGYRLQRNGVTVTTTSSATLAYNDTGLTSSTSYTYTVVALDAAGNASAAATLTTPTKANPGDTNADGHVDLTDLTNLIFNFHTTTASCDFNGDGTVDILDASILFTYYGT